MWQKVVWLTLRVGVAPRRYDQLGVLHQWGGVEAAERRHLLLQRAQIGLARDRQGRQGFSGTYLPCFYFLEDLREPWRPALCMCHELRQRGHQRRFAHAGRAHFEPVEMLGFCFS